MLKETPEGGIYIERKVYLSKAYLALGKNGRMALLAFLDARQTNRGYKKAVKKGFRAERFIDLDKIKMPYTKLKDYGIPIQSCNKVLDELLAKGFIELKHQGGAGEHDQSVYALIDDYLTWTDGKVFRRRPKDVRRGFQGKRLGATALRCKTCGGLIEGEDTWAGFCADCYWDDWDSEERPIVHLKQISHAKSGTYTHSKSGTSDQK